MLRIRLTRVGKKNSPAYRVVIADKRRAVKRKFIEIIGHYNPTLKPKEIVINKERALFWVQNGAQPSDTVNNLMCGLGILDKKEMINKVHGKKLSKKAIKAGPAEEKAEAPVAETETETEGASEAEPETPVETAETESVEVAEEEPKAEVVENEAPAEEANTTEETEKPAEDK